MIASNTVYVSQEGPANALAINKDSTQVVIAGRNVFKVFAIGENEFSEVCNLRVGKNLNLNFSSIDVAWSGIEENTIATAATNGAVVVWNLARTGRSKQEHVFSDHKRTVNKVSFHLTEPHLLISGSQDGMMKCFDLRMKEVARTFISNTESIRDVQFSPHSTHTFAAVSENGAVQLWDSRRHERCAQQFTAHSGPVFACDWHPTENWLATASRDKTIKVWDVFGKPNLEYTIHTIASVGHIKWRPQRKYQIASCALVLDCAVQAWDVRRPHLPLASFAEHRDVTTALAWLATPMEFLSTSRDCTLYRHRWAAAAHPVLWGGPRALAFSPRGSVAASAPARPAPPVDLARNADRPVPQLGRKQPTAGSLTPASQAALEREFPHCGRATLTRFENVEPDTFTAIAKEYKVSGAPVHELAKHNAEVARKYNRPVTAHIWDIIELEYSERLGRGGAGAPPAAPAPPPRPPQPAAAPEQPPYSAALAEEASPVSLAEWSGAFRMNGVLGMPTAAIYVPPQKYADMAADDEPVWVSAATQHYVDEDAIDWTLPEEAFPLRAPASAPLPMPPAPCQPCQPCQPNQPCQGPGGQREDEISAAMGLMALGGASPPSSGSSDAGIAAPAASNAVFTDTSELTVPPEQFLGGLGGLGAAGAEDYSFAVAPLLAAALRQHATLGDVQTPAVVMIALQDYRSDLAPYIDESLQEQWITGYVEMMWRRRAWAAALLAARGARAGGAFGAGVFPAHHAPALTLCCGRCHRRLKPHQPCDRCQPKLQPFLCEVCQRVVRGLYAWCQGCSHGGHLRHMREWLEKHQVCPAGCGHQCQLG